MGSLGGHEYICAAHRRVHKTCPGEIRREIDVDGESDALKITWLFYVPPGPATDHPSEIVRLPLMTTHRSVPLWVSTIEDGPGVCERRAFSRRSGRLGGIFEAVQRRLRRLFVRRRADSFSLTVRDP
jgi:hypothetical protein